MSSRAYLVAIVALVAGGCSLNVSYEGTTFSCADGGTCPVNYTCGPDSICVPTTEPAPACSDMAAAGESHACSLRPDGTVWCWGSNDHGQLGNGTAADSSVPVQVMGLTGATAIAAGDSFTCAIVAGGMVECWGRNMYGELGDGTTSDARMPLAPVKNLSGIVSIAAGNDHACAIDGGGTLSCWGNNEGGQLGDGTMTNRPVPGPIGPAAKVVVGGLNTCSIDAGGVLKCWGANDSGQLGTGNVAPARMPMQIATDVKAVGIGDAHICYVTNGGALFCAGHADGGQLGNGQPGDVNVFFQVAMPAKLIDLQLSDHRTCGLDDAKGVWCWGNSEEGRIGDGEWSTRWLPTKTLFTDVVQLAGGYTFTCVRDSAGSVRCMGSNDFGQLGNGMRTTRGAPQPVPMATGITSLSAGGGNTCGITTTGDVMCWGAGGDGQNADGTFDDRSAVGAALGLKNIVQVSLGGSFGCARDSAGAVLCWGENNLGQLGQGNTYYSALPHVVTLPGPASDVTAGDINACANVGGTVYCWGHNADGELGRGSTSYYETTPAPVMNLTGALDVSCGDEFCCAITPTNTVQCWGNNGYGKLGNGMPGTDSSVPVDVTGLTNVMEIASRGNHTFARLASGAVSTWGYNCDGRLGTMPGNCGTNGTPLMVASLTNATKLASGWDASCALRSDNTVACWGPGWNGEIGDSQYTTHSTPIPVALTGVTDVVAGGEHVCALMMDKSVQCWGQDDSGQLGDGAHWQRTPAGARLTCQ